MPIARDGYIMPMMMTRACVAQVNLARAIGAFTSARSSRRKSDDSSAYDDESVAEESSKAGSAFRSALSRAKSEASTRKDEPPMPAEGDANESGLAARVSAHEPSLDCLFEDFDATNVPNEPLDTSGRADDPRSRNGEE